jgi:Asp-tRNA(Asn)/Glu-tRNA(Gln) amidotransferase A subunit family amidase
VSRSVRDSAAILDATSGPAPGDPYWAPPPARPFLGEVGADPGRLRIAVTTAAPGGEKVHEDCVAAAIETARLCESLGHIVEEAAPVIDAEQLAFAMRVIIGGNLRNGMDLRLQALGREQRQGDVERITALWAQDARRYSSADYARALFLIHGLGRRFGAFFGTYDVLISPTLANPPLKLGATDMMSDDLEAYHAMLFTQIPFTPPFNVTGCPAASLPLHWTGDGLPVGVQIGAAFGDEATIFRLSAQLEAARPWAGRVPPGLAAVA